jgi:hypothetical protein
VSEWPTGKALPHPFRLLRGIHSGRCCNAEIVDDSGAVVDYCDEFVTSYDRGIWRWKITAGTHRGPHVRPGEGTG